MSSAEWYDQQRAAREHLREQFASILGSTIVDVIPVPRAICAQYGWDEMTTGMLLRLDDGRALIAVTDQNGSGAGHVLIDDRRTHRTHGEDNPDDTIPAGGTVSLDLIATLLQAQGLPARVEQTGGGVAAICIGPTITNAAGPDRDVLMVGPGGFDGPEWTLAYGQLGDLSAGPDDDGRDRSFLVSFDGPTTHRMIAQQASDLYRRYWESLP